jgi:hypothetical protein
MKQFCSFSGAIRAADGIVLQSFFGRYAREILGVDDGAVCAIEAGVKMLGVSRDFRPGEIYSFISQCYPYLTTVSRCPQCVEYVDSLTNVIWHLNDFHRLTFVQIADWLESEEEKLGFVTVVEAPIAVSETVTV